MLRTYLVDGKFSLPVKLNNQMTTAELLLGELNVALGGLAVEHGHGGLVREAPGAPGDPHPLQRLGRGEGLHHQHLRGNV